MRMLICEWLVADGHRVHSLPRHDPREREASHASVGLVVLDLPHPRTNASGTLRLVQEVRETYRGASIVGISTQVGRNLGSSSVASRALDVEGLLAKPCTRGDLLGAVTAVL